MSTPTIEVRFEQVDGDWNYFYSYSNCPLTFGPFGSEAAMFEDIGQQYDMTEPNDFEVDPR